MKDVQAVAKYIQAQDRGSTCVLATLVSVDGSSYRRAGARMLLLADGRRIGSISGGCLEEDVLIHAREVAADGRPKLLAYDTGSENELVWGPGSGCGGTVRVLLERVSGAPAWAVALKGNLGAGRPTRIETVWAAQDPALLGTRLADENAVEDLASPPGSGTPRPNLSVFSMVVEPAPHLFIYGAGDDARPLARFASELGWGVTVADPRAAFASIERFPGVCRLVVGPPDELIGRTAPGPSALAVVMTHSFSHDLGLVRHLINRPLAYLGLLGARMRTEKLLDALAASGSPVQPELRARLHAPIGLDIGAEGPEEVALSIVAEIQAAITRRNARPLRERKGPIHE